MYSPLVLRLSNSIIKVSGFFRFFELNCKLLDCKLHFKVTSIPKLVLLKRGPSSIASRILNNSELEFRDLADLVDDIQFHFKSSIREILNKTVSQSSYHSRVHNKFPVFYMHNQNVINPAVHLIASQKAFSDKYEFFMLSYPHPHILAQLKDSNLPKVVIIWQDLNDTNVKTFLMSKELNYINLKAFLEEFEVKFWKTEENKIIENSLHLKEEITLIEHYDSYKLFCVDKAKPCIIAFLDGRHNPESLKEFHKGMIVLDQIRSNPENYIYSISWINGTCHPNLNKRFDIQSLPHLIVLLPIKNISSVFIGSFTSKKITHFLKSFAKRKTIITQFTVDESDFSRERCQEIPDQGANGLIKNNIGRTSEEDALVKEVILEDQKRRKTSQTELKQKKKSTKAKKKNGKAKRKDEI